MTRRCRHPAVPYLVAAVAVALAAAVRMALNESLGDRQPFATFYVAVLFAALYLGAGPAILAGVLGLGVGAYSFMAPVNRMALDDSTDVVAMVVYLAVAAASVALCLSDRRLRTRFEELEAGRRRAEASEWVRRERLQATLRSIGEGVLVTGPDGRVALINHVAEQLTGWSEAEAIGRRLGEVLHLVDAETTVTEDLPLADVLGGGPVHRPERSPVLVARDGSSRPVEPSTSAIRDGDGRVAGAVIVVRDVSERQRAEQSARFLAGAERGPGRAGRRGRGAADRRPAGRARLRRLVRRRPRRARRPAAAGRGRARRPGEARPRPRDPRAVSARPRGAARRLSGPADRPVGVDGRDPRRRSSSRRPATSGTSSCSGRSACGRTCACRSGRGTGSLGVLTFVDAESGRRYGPADVATAEDLAHRAAIALENARLYHRLRDSEERFRLLTEALPQIVWTVGADGRLDYLNRRWYEYTGLTEAESYADGNGYGAIHPEDRPAVQARWTEALATGLPFEAEYRLRAGSAAHRWHLGRAVPIRGEDGLVARWFGTATDIDDRKRAERTLAFLAAASALLAEPVDFERTPERIARLVVPVLADGCVVYLDEPDGAVRRAAIAHVDPEAERRMHADLDGRPIDPAAPLPSPVAEALRTGRSVLIPAFTEADFERLVDDPERRARLRGEMPRSLLVSPLLAGGRAVGAVALSLHAEGRRYGPDDLPVAEDLARRAAIALENARLIRELRTADRRKTEFLAVLAHELRNPLAPIRSAPAADGPARGRRQRRRPRRLRGRARDGRAPGRAHGPADRRPDGRLADQPGQDRAPARAGRAGGAGRPGRRGDRPADRGGRPRPGPGASRRPGLAPGRPGAARAGRLEPADQRRPLHRPRRPDRPGGSSRTATATTSSSGSGTPASASRRRCSGGSSTSSSRPATRRAVGTAGSGSA